MIAMHRRWLNPVATATLLLAAAAAHGGGGDTCGTAANIGTIPFSDTGSTCVLTNRYAEACPSASVAADAVYHYLSPVDQCVDLSLCQGTGFDTRLYVYDAEAGGCPPPDMGDTTLDVACDDDGCPGPSTASRIRGLQLSAGKDYWFVIEGAVGDDCGGYLFRMAPCGVLCAANADCDDDEPCTTDVCISGQCQHDNVSDMTPCDDGSICTTMDECVGGTCTGDAVPDCADCNQNDVDDATDLATGASDDCNLNGVPDECDLVSGESQDADRNGVPDECSFFVPTQKPPHLWSQAANWDPEEVPQNMPDRPYFVTIDNPPLPVRMDLPVTIATLRLIGGAILRVDEPDAMVPPDLEVVHPRGMRLRGSLRVAHNRHVDVINGPTVIGTMGEYRRVLTAVGNVSARLTTAGLAIREGSPGGVVQLDRAMQLRVNGTLLLDGLAGAEPLVTAMVCTPPILRSSEDAETDANGDIELRGEAVWEVNKDESTSTATATAGTPMPDVRLAGSLVDHATAPALIDVVNGYIRLDGAAPQSWEVAGEDRGPVETGFMVNRAWGVIEIAAGANVTFANQFDNLYGIGACAEAQYVDLLVLRAGTQLHVDNCRLYYRTLIDEGGTVTSGGDACSGLFPMTGDCNLDGTTDLDEISDFAACLAGPDGPPPGPPCECLNLDQDDSVDLQDWSMLVNGFDGQQP